MNILTFDIEEWFHILDNDSTRTEREWNQYQNRIHQNMERILEMLERKKQKATFFCLGWIARKHPDIIKRIDSCGYEIGTHSDMHQLAYEQSRKEFESDLDLSIKSISDITGKKIRAYRVPGFSITDQNKWVFEVLVEKGIEIDCSIFPAKRAHGGFEKFGIAEPAIISVRGLKIKEFPVNLYKIGNKNLIFSGGGYFRVLPYWCIVNFMKKSGYVMAYFHPRDFDAEQPMIEELSLVRRFKSYYGLKSAFKKLERLIGDFEFVDLETANQKVNWENARVINL